MRALVIGVSGQVGSELYKQLSIDPDNVVRGTYCNTNEKFSSYERLDICDRVAVKNLIQGMAPNFIFIPAALTHVDKCQNNPDANDINFKAIKNIVDASYFFKSKIIYYSTDYIFDGMSGPYSEFDLPNPINDYGKQKLSAEHYLLSNCPFLLIIRTHGVFGPDAQRKNFAARVIDTLRKGKPMPAVIDEFGTPTYGPDLVKRSIELAQTMNGVVHLTGSDFLSRYKFAHKIAEVFNLDGRLIEPISSRVIIRDAMRPLVCGLTSVRADALLGVDEALAKYLNEIRN